MISSDEIVATVDFFSGEALAEGEGVSSGVAVGVSVGVGVGVGVGVSVGVGVGVGDFFLRFGEALPSDEGEAFAFDEVCRCFLGVAVGVGVGVGLAVLFFL